MPVAVVRVRAKRDNVTTINATLMKGDVGECPKERAMVLIGRGEVELVEGELKVPGMGLVEAAKGDRAERAVNRAAATAERQEKKG